MAQLPWLTVKALRALAMSRWVCKSVQQIDSSQRGPQTPGCASQALPMLLSDFKKAADTALLRPLRPEMGHCLVPEHIHAASVFLDSLWHTALQEPIG